MGILAGQWYCTSWCNGKKQVETAKKIGLNITNFHRTMEERIFSIMQMNSVCYIIWRTRKAINILPMGSMQPIHWEACKPFFILLTQWKNYPGWYAAIVIVIHSFLHLHNERGAEPQEQDRAQMLAALQVGWNEDHYLQFIQWFYQQGPDPRFKLHLLPYDFTFYDYGWFDQLPCRWTGHLSQQSL